MRFFQHRACCLAIAALCAASDLPKQSAGRYQVTLRLPAGGIYVREEAEIEFRVEDTSRPDPPTGFSPVVRAELLAVIDMPEMPAMAKFSETAHAEGVPGDYGIHPTFAHGGEYRLRLDVRPPAGDAFTVEFPLRVLDAEGGGRRKPAPPRYSMEVALEPRKPKAGQPVEMRLTIRDRDRENAVVTQFDTVHEALLHLMIVRRDLAHFALEHPAASPDGTFRLTYMFDGAGDYRFADVAPKGAGRADPAGATDGGGRHGPRVSNPKRLERWPPVRREAGHSVVELAAAAPSLPSCKTLPVDFPIKEARSGKAVEDLEPYLGAMGHLLLVHEDAATFVHSHPDDRAGQALRFLTRLPKPGLYRAWLQFCRGGRLWTADFLLHAEAAP